LYFDAIKESRGSYFVEYQPPVSDNPFATMSIVYPGTFELKQVAETMRTEMIRWLDRYPVPVMIWAYDVAENSIQPNGSSDDGLLVGWLAPGTGEIGSSSKLKELPPFLNDTTALRDWRTIYKDVPFRTDTQVKADAQAQLQKTRKQNLTLKIFLVLWVAVIPAAWETLQHFGPGWLALAVYVYALWRAFRTGRKLFGRNKPSRSEEEKSEKERKMAHYYYHCELNPTGFASLKVENFEKDISERTRKEARRAGEKRVITSCQRLSRAEPPARP
jgi:hypothetical protein